MNLFTDIVPVLITLILSAVLTWIVLKLSQKYHLGLPIRQRDVHQKPIPRIGGVAILVSFFLVALGYHLVNKNNFSGFGFPFEILGFSIDKRLLAVLVGSLLIGGSMIIDDIRGLKAYQKLLVQILVGLVIVAGGIGIKYLNNPFGGPTIYLDQWQIPIIIGGATYHIIVLADLLSVIWLVLLMNVLNFTDGIDGLAGTIGASAMAVLMLLSLTAAVNQPSTALLASIGFGAVLGFLFWNLPPAKIFMGDSGSMFIGFLLGVLGLIAGAKLATTLVVLAIPILDSLLVVFTRVVRGQNPLTHADQTHLHHRFINSGFTVRQTLVILGGVSILLGVAALQNTGMGKIRLFILAIVVMVMFMSSIYLLRRRVNSGN